MNWIVFIWTSAASGCLTLAWVFGIVWWQQRRLAVGHLVFAVAAIATAAMTLVELRAQSVESTTTYGQMLQWAHVLVWVLVVALVGITWFYLKSGRLWLAWTTLGLRTLALILNFAFPPNLNFREISALGQITFLGERSVYPIGVINPLMAVGMLSHVFLIAFVGDASVAVWRRGDRRQAATIGGGIIFMIVISVVHGLLVQTRVVHTPIMTSLYYCGIMVMMGIELSYAVAKSDRVGRELHESQTRVQLATTSARLAVWTWDISRREVHLSPAGRSLHGLPADGEITDDRFLGTFAAEDRPSIQRQLHAAARELGELRSEGRVILPDGTTRWLDLHGKVVPGDATGARRLTGISLDISERKQWEHRLQDAAKFSRTVLDSLQSNIAILDRTGKIVAVNEPWGRFSQANGGATSTLGIGADYLRVCREAAATGDAAAERTAEGLQAVLEGGSMLFELEYPCHSPAQARWFIMRAVPLVSTEGGAVVSHTDITHLRAMEREKEQLRRELEHTGRVSLLGELSGSLAHELNQPLAAILANAQAANRWMAKGEPDLTEVKAILEDIIAEDKRAGEIVSRVRALARKATPERKLVDLNQVVRDTAAMLRSELIAVDLPLRLELDPALPPVRGGQIELQQTLLNLLLNGLQAQAETDRVQRSLTVITRLADNQVIIAVRDSGPGLSDEVKARIFESFFTTKQTGMGLGLALCRRTAENHGGRLSADNHPEGGAIFSLSLPISQPD